MKKYFSDKTFCAGIILFSLILVFLISGQIFIRYAYDAVDTAHKLEGFSKEHIFGTDYLGRDIFARIIKGLKISLFISLCAVIPGAVAGTVLGAAAGYFEGITDSIITKLTDTQMAFPGILIALMLIAVFGNSIGVTILALSLMGIPRFIRISRSGFLKYKNSLFVLSAKAKGAGNLRIIFIHILPNIIPELIVTMALNFALCILSESGLSYLGLGVQPPLPSFGRMLSEGQRFIIQQPSNVIIPAVILILLVLSMNLIGDGITSVNRNK
ncbi:ABC transporter permease [Treponema sp.]|uniref:ABC transporter permease n=1 Tax=Treponema sp. TaxID=166 RepID=UPI00298E0ABF|nr:ABC transporter permease [Treponema sp.]MCR5613138.1 ABC transporter permease [Treponema sp.]